MTSQPEAEIKAALSSLLAGIGRGDGAVITSEIEKLEELTDHGRTRLHPQLLHFLERRSYAKALLFLGGAADIPTGACGGRPAKG